MDRINAAIRAIESREPGESFSYKKIAESFGVVRSTLTRHHRRQIGQDAITPHRLRHLNDEEEIELLSYIKKLTERGLPPTRQMIQSFASTIAKKQVSMSWVDRFVRRNPESLICRWTTGMDRNRHTADSRHKYELYFSLLSDKIDRYSILAGDTYNMDEKGFMIGMISRSKRIFDRPLWDSHTVRQVIQDGNRDWVSLIACICADGTCLDPALVYTSTVNNIRDTWLEDFHADQHQAFFTASENGWSNNQIGLAWLRDVFDRQTKHHSRRYRLLIVDGHGSHVSMDFIDYCDRNRILLAIFPPHATHTLQPLDVVVFKPLSTAYTDALSDHMFATQGLSSITMRDFWRLFYDAWSRTMEPLLILSAFEATGISPLHPERILDRFDQGSPSPGPSTPDSSTSALSASEWHKINTLLRAVFGVGGDNQARKLSQTVHHIAIQKQLLEDENKHLREALTSKKRRINKGRPLPLDRSDSYHGGAQFWSPRSVERARQRQHQKDLEDAEKERQKVDRANVREANKLLKARLLEEKRAKRVADRELIARRRADEAREKHLRKLARIAKQQHQKTLKIANSRRQVPSTPRKQKALPKKVPSVAVEEVDVASSASTPSTRRGRTIKTPSRYR